MSRWLRTACAALAFSTSGHMALQPAAAEPVSDPASNALRRWVKVNSNSVTLDQALTIAGKYDVVVANQFALVPHVAAMRTANPGIRILVYMNGTYSRPREVYNENLYSHDSAGRRITALSDGGVLMHPGREAWRTDVANECRVKRSETGYDGCYVDVLGVAPLSASYGSARPVRPGTGMEWTARQWLKATTGLAAHVKAMNPDAYIMVNGLQNGRRYADPAGASSVILSGVEGGNAEDFTRIASLPSDEFRAEWMWKADVDMIVDAESRGKSVFAMTKVWVSATQQQIDRAHEYALASFLLGTNGTSYFTFYSGLERMDVLEVTMPNRFDSVDLGLPTGAYGKVNNVYTRSFTRGLVLVNPTSAMATVDLFRAHVDVDGTTQTSVVLPPNTARILTHAA